MYGRVENFLINNLSEDRLVRKMHCCQTLLDTLDILDPGLSRLRG